MTVAGMVLSYIVFRCGHRTRAAKESSYIGAKVVGEKREWLSSVTDPFSPPLAQ
jgi:hypothetical protein